MDVGSTSATDGGRGNFLWPRRPFVRVAQLGPEIEQSSMEVSSEHIDRRSLATIRTGRDAGRANADVYALR